MLRSLATLGLTTVVGCGLDLGGAASAAPDGQGAEDASTGAGVDVDGGADTRISPIESGVLADATDRARAAEAMTSLDGNISDSTVTNDASGNDGSDGGAVDGVSLDGPLDVVTTDVITTSACVSAIPAGWNLVIYDLATDPCPSSFTAHDVSGTTALQSGACLCSCTVAQNGDCLHGTLAVHPSGGVNSSCDLDAGWSAALSGPGCTAIGTSLGVTGPHSDEAMPLPGQGGTCSDTPQADPTKFTAAAARYCDVPAAGADSVCNGTVPSGFAACIVTEGETTCPSGTPFVNAYIVEDAAALQCSSCAGCTVTTTCSNALLTGYSDMGCSPRAIIGSVGIDGGCNPVNLNMVPSMLVSIEYSATASSSCTPGSSTASAELTNPRTICCR